MISKIQYFIFYKQLFEEIFYTAIGITDHIFPMRDETHLPYSRRIDIPYISLWVFFQVRIEDILHQIKILRQAFLHALHLILRKKCLRDMKHPRTRVKILFAGFAPAIRHCSILRNTIRFFYRASQIHVRNITMFLNDIHDLFFTICMTNLQRWHSAKSHSMCIIQIVIVMTMRPELFQKIVQFILVSDIIPPHDFWVVTEKLAAGYFNIAICGQLQRIQQILIVHR